VTKPKVVPINKSANAEVVRKLKEALEMAERGEVRAMAFVGILGNGSMVTVYAFGDDSRPYLSLIGGLQVLARRVDCENQ